MPDEIPVIRPRLQRQRSLRIFNGTLTGKRSSWSELKGAGSSGGSLKLSPAKAKKLLDECTNMTDWEGYADESADDSAKAQKGICSNRIRKRGIVKFPSLANRQAVTTESNLPPEPVKEANQLGLVQCPVPTAGVDRARQNNPFAFRCCSDTVQRLYHTGIASRGERRI